MEPHENRIARDAVASVRIHADISRDPAATLPSVAPTVPRHHFTLTVEQVCAELFAQGFGRDDRTVQRWCKAGKLSAIVDEVHGDRYLIDSSSLRDILATLVAERDSRATPPFSSSRSVEFAATAPRPSFDTAPTNGNFAKGASHDTRPDEAPAQPRHAASETDEVAALKRRIEELEKDKMMLTVDKQVREQMVDYMKEKFDSMIDHALDRSMEVGQLKAEVTHLRTQLPAPAPVPERGYEPHQFTPLQVRQRPETVDTDATWERQLEV